MITYSVVFIIIIYPFSRCVKTTQHLSSKNGLYMVWTHHSIYFEKSIDGGGTFGDPINLSKNTDRDSYLPYIAASGNNIYAVWTVASDRNHAIFFTKSTDGGHTFSDPVNLSKNTE